MLVLDRFGGQEITIGESIVVRIIMIGEDHNKRRYVRVGIDAPKNIAVHRRGIYRALKEEVKGGEVPSFAEKKP